MKKGGERLMVADGAMPPGAPVIPLTPEQAEMERAIENFELYHRKCEPLTNMRYREGIPIVTKEMLKAKLELRQAPFRKKLP